MITGDQAGTPVIITGHPYQQPPTGVDYPYQDIGVPSDYLRLEGAREPPGEKAELKWN